MEKDVDSGPCQKNLNKGLTFQNGIDNIGSTKSSI
jgi:hypothetical protein